MKMEGMKSVSGLKNDLKAAAAAAAADDELVRQPGERVGTLRVIHPRCVLDARGASSGRQYLGHRRRRGTGAGTRAWTRSR